MKRPALQNDRVGVLRLSFRDFRERRSCDARLSKGFNPFCQNCQTGSEMQRINAAELTSCLLKLPIFSFVRLFDVMNKFHLWRWPFEEGPDVLHHSG